MDGVIIMIISTFTFSGLMYTYLQVKLSSINKHVKIIY